MERNDRLARLTAHSADCTDCQAAPLPLDRIASLLDNAVPQIDAAALSRHALVRLQRPLQRHALRLSWQQVAIGMLLSLLPLPFVLAYNAYLLQRVYGYLTTLLPATIAAYLVLSYAAALLLLFAATYAAIPLFLVRHPAHSPTATA